MIVIPKFINFWLLNKNSTNICNYVYTSMILILLISVARFEPESSVAMVDAMTILPCRQGLAIFYCIGIADPF
jgi:hypothetical protein